MRLISVIVFIVVIAGCSNEVDTSLDIRPFPVIYSIIERSDTLHEVYVAKSFSGDGGPLIDAAIADSIYFNNLEIEITFKNRIDSIKLPLVRGYKNSLKEGVFCPDHAQYYYVNANIQDYDWYRLSVFILDEEPIVSQAKLIDKPDIIYPPQISH